MFFLNIIFITGKLQGIIFNIELLLILRPLIKNRNLFQVLKVALLLKESCKVSGPCAHM